MVATLTRLLFFPAGKLHAIVNATTDQEVATSRAPIGGVVIDVPKISYDACRTEREVLVLTQAALAQISPQAAAGVAATIQAIDDAAAAAAASDAANQAAAAAAQAVVGAPG